jgi:hypothetical protein
MTQPTIDTTQTLLVGIEMRLPPQSRELKQVSQQAETKANAKSGTTTSSLHYWKWEEESIKTFTKGKNKGKTKSSIVKFDGLETLRSFQSSYKNALEHYARFPFATGAKLLPAALAEPFFKTKEQYEKQLPEVWKKWAYDEYPSLASNAPSRMGAFYSGEDFPTLDACFEAFQCEVTVIPLASADQWQRIALLAPDLASAQQKLTDEAYGKGMKEAHEKLWAQVMEPIQHAVDTLSKDKTKIYDSLVGNIISIVDLVPAYNNVFKDSKLTELAEQAKKAFSEIKPDDLRASQEAKAAMLESAKNIVNTFKPYARKLAV